jgi:hypothetical protein
MADTETSQDRDKESLHEWRYKAALNLGLSKLEANVFADSGVPLHDLLDLVAKGCPPRTAFDILT